jgi:hypothetical protein
MIVRGLKFQEAIQLAAEGILTEGEMASQLNMSPGTLTKLNRDPIFIRRVGQERAALGVERSAAGKRGGEQAVRGFYGLRAAEKPGYARQHC